MGAWADFARFEDDGIAAGEWGRERPDAENDRGIPGGDGEDDAGGLADAISG
ncbi:hypothetical protein D3C87_2201390 [compost metagenome]